MTTPSCTLGSLLARLRNRETLGRTAYVTQALSHVEMLLTPPPQYQMVSKGEGVMLQVQSTDAWHDLATLSMHKDVS